MKGVELYWDRSKDNARAIRKGIWKCFPDPRPRRTSKRAVFNRLFSHIFNL